MQGDHSSLMKIEIKYEQAFYEKQNHHSFHPSPNQCDQIGLLLTVFDAKCSYKNIQMFGYF